MVQRTFSPGQAYSGDYFPTDQRDPIAFTQLGFVVWVVDGRGSAHRRRDFRAAFTPELEGRSAASPNSIEDHIAALHQLGERHPFIDLSRVGLFGVSAGGSQTLVAMLMASELYPVGVVIAGSTDTYSAAYNILDNVKNLEGKLLLINGLDDNTVPISHSYRLISKLTAHQKDYDLVVLPGQGHLIQGNSARYARRAMANFLLEHLQGDIGVYGNE